MRITTLSLLILTCSHMACLGSVILGEGDTVWAEFDEMSLLDRPTSGWAIRGFLGEGEEYQIRFFEDSIFDPPIFVQTVRNDREMDINGFLIFGPSSDGHFSDQQGAVVVEMIAGSMNLQSVAVVTEIDGGDYLANIVTFNPIPEPTVGCSILLAGVLLVGNYLTGRDRHRRTRRR